MPRGERHESHRDIDLVQEQWRLAILKADATTLDGLLANDYVGITASGTLRTKEQTLAAVRSGQFHLYSLMLFDRKIRFYGSTALVNGKALATGTTRGTTEMNGAFRFSQVFVRDAKGRWKIVSLEINRIREPREHRDHDHPASPIQ